VDALAERFATIIRDNGGEVSKIENCTLQTLAYPIKKNRKGHYVLMNITAPSAALDEMSRLMGLSEDILRFLNVVVAEHEKGPSALLKASRYDDTDTRDNRGGDGRERRPYHNRSNDSAQSPTTGTDTNAARPE
jgi:small subunit ribosomal protein S6